MVWKYSGIRIVFNGHFPHEHRLGGGHKYDSTSIWPQFDRSSTPIRLQFDRATTTGRPYRPTCALAALPRPK